MLIVDADPHCNLTGLTLGLEDYQSLFAFYDSKQNTDIFSSLAPVFALQRPSVIAHTGKTPITPTKNANLFILAGNIKFSEMAIQIATALTSSGTIPILRQFVSAFNTLMRNVAEEHNIDVVLVDMSPSVSATNQCILMGSDYFIIPVSPDFYCFQAIDSLSNVLPKWAGEMKKFKDGEKDSLPEHKPGMPGFISQNYRIYTTHNSVAEGEQKKMAKAYLEWLEKIKAIVSSKLVPSLEKADMIVDEKLFRESVTYDKPYHLAGIQDFSSLLPVSQKLSKPIFNLSEKDGDWSGASWKHQDKNHKEHGVKVNIEEAGKVYAKLADAVLKMI